MVRPAIALEQPHLIAVGMAVVVQPRPFVETIRFHNESIPFPMPYGISIKGRIRILRQLPSVGTD